jgi:SAM-dependent methyltransferase
MAINHITLDPPYFAGDDQAILRIIGWCEIADPAAPNVTIEINGRPVTPRFGVREDVRASFPDISSIGIAVKVDCAAVLAGADTMQDKGGFLLSVRVTADERERTFEYAVSPGWLRAVFGKTLRPYPVAPPHLQVRVAGAAAGAFVAEGRIVADQLVRILTAQGVAYPANGRVHDFGAGPGRVLAVLAGRYPSATYSASDIDPEAMAWCAREMADLATFSVNGHAPPLDIPDDTLDLVYSISVFTHLPEAMQDAWLAELRRVLKPGGHLLTTVINPLAYDLPEPVRAAALRSGFAYFGDAAPVDGLPDFYRLAYHTADYVRRSWGRFFEVLHVGAHDLNDTQDAVLLRKPAA